MNFLAHLYLSGDNEKRLVGNFIGDFVKGRRALQQFEPEIVKGIMLHRAIDEYTDTHPIVTASKNRLRPKYRHYSGVIADVFYDHFLAKNWSLFHITSLSLFAEHSYRVIQGHNNILPKDVKAMLPYMIRGNWLVNYASLEGIHRALSGMASRTPYESKMEQATQDLKNDYAAYEAEFKSFFPALSAFCQQKNAELDHVRE